mmetsp:Transcript_38588/g.46679  ORF Transcript_38588/g.46679 Transcript_38588/m.46679 type:complete len:323 (-) Transcript_38588:137-1105(-)|eukprot:CAMPEP_0197848050 /NCGR_PEP_ID=MMETSP1438-20131217/7898_1 /TAXON_ID=1461541 /ORGANISM="Pterosperma sp., Strain CCMP1384" /LENGTH=322 /DNA_ID=CAMNT_0043460177 /DNA_START=271 /DNA_END=1239 /DNA_ORIENTATION=+
MTKGLPHAVFLLTLLSAFSGPLAPAHAQIYSEEEQALNLLRADGHGLRLEVWKYYKGLRALPNLIRRIPDQKTIMMTMDVGANGEEEVWKELQQFNYPIMQAGYTRYDGKTYTADFAARLTGRIYIDHTSTYTFYLTVDDGAKLMIGGHLLLTIDGVLSGEAPAPRRDFADQFLTKGLHDIQLEYFQRNNSTIFILEYSASSIPRTIIPPEKLFQPGGDFCLAKCGDAQCRNNPLNPHVVECIGQNEGQQLTTPYEPLNDEMQHTPSRTCQHPCMNPGSTMNTVDHQDQNPARFVSDTYWLQSYDVWTPDRARDTDTDSEEM